MRMPPGRLALLAALLLSLALGVASPAAADVPVPGPGTVLAPGSRPLPKNLTGTSFLVSDLDTGEILAAKDAHHRLLPASTLKVLTALALLPRIDKKRRITPSYDDVIIEGSRVGLIENVKYPAYQVFRAMLMTSGNDAANTLADTAGGKARTAQLMNEEAARLGARDTHAVNPSGLDAPGQLSTAYDLALIGRAAMAVPDFRSYVGTKRSTIIGRMGKPLQIATHDKLLYNYPGAIGVKNGYTVRAGATYIGAATHGGRSILVTMMHAQARIWPEIAALLDWGFAAENAGAIPIGRLEDPPGYAVPAALSLAGPAGQVRAAAAHTRAAPHRSAVPAAIAGIASLALASFLLRARRRRRPQPSRRRSLPRF